MNSTPSPDCRGPAENNQGHRPNLQQENTPPPLGTDCKEASIPSDLDPDLSCAKELCSKSSPKSLVQKQRSVISENVRITPRVKTVGRLKEDTSPYVSKDKQSPASAEPIVLYSDEEECTERKDQETLYLQPVQEHTTESKQEEQEFELPVLDELMQGVTKSKTKQFPAESCAHGFLTETPSCSTSSKQMDPALDIKITTLYMGKFKGIATGCVTFTTRYIKIPFQVALNKNVELLVDTIHLRRIGLWRNNDDSHSSKSNTVLFLWLSKNYVEQVESQLGKAVSKPAKSSEFIFLELFQPPTEREQMKLNEVILEVSKNNNLPDLSDFLSWKQAFPLFDDLSSENSSFINCCHDSFQQQLKKNSAPALMESLSQESKINVIEPNYAVLQKQNNGHYSISMSPKPADEWKEIRETGPVQNLIVYPPPPTKGGLGVTREDLECLEHGEFLNDVIIDFYLKYLLLEKAPKHFAERSHIFSSFFYKCLTRMEKNSEENPNLSVAQRRHKRVKTWTRHINIFSKDYIFVPVNEESHWYIAVICFPGLEEAVYEMCPDQCSLQPQTQQSPFQSEKKTETVRTHTIVIFSDNGNDKQELDINSNLQPKGNDQHTTLSPTLDSKNSKSSSSNSKIKKLCKRPCILILDSLKASSLQNTIHILREYLEVEWEVKRKTHREFSKSTMIDFCPRVPKQDNSSDCGVYLLQYVETFFQVQC
uniref:SUMO specific peptidase 7 n=1 Tax=Sphenodon punctatus TaxID=8508 RepID=A0A8D0HHB2_SPHPU